MDLLESMIQNGQLEIAFIDYRLQAKLYRYALEERGWSKEELRKVIAYPRGRGVKAQLFDIYGVMLTICTFGSMRQIPLGL